MRSSSALRSFCSIAAAVVVLRGAELEVLEGVVDLATEARGELDLGLGLGALAQDALRLLVVVPEPWRQRPLGQIFEDSLEPRDVKDAPLAPQSAF